MFYILFISLCKEKWILWKTYKEFKKNKFDNIGKDDLIYIPNVTVFKTDESISKLKFEEYWFKTDAISFTSLQLSNYYDKTKFRIIMESRKRKIMMQHLNEMFKFWFLILKFQQL